MSSLDTDELSDKYSRLVQEYSKIKAQNAVLKKAVLSEQEKSESLQNTLKTKDQLMRKSTQDIDQLMFHNENLTKRIASLQADLSEPKSKGSWISLNRQELRKKEEELEATASDLGAKIKENEALHSKLQETLTSSSRKVAALEKRNKELTGELDQLRATSSQQIEDLTQELRAQKEKTFKFERTAFDQKADLEMCHKRIQELSDELVEKTTQAEKILRDHAQFLKNKILFNDTQDPALNTLNNPLFDRDIYSEHLEILEKAEKIWVQLSSSLTLFHEGYQTRVIVLLSTASSEELTDVNTRLHHLLGSHSASFKTMESCFEQFVRQFKTPPHQRKTQDPEDFEALFHLGFREIVSYYQQLLPTLVLSLKEESGRSNPQGSLVKSRNDLLVGTLTSLLTTFEKTLQSFSADQKKPRRRRQARGEGNQDDKGADQEGKPAEEQPVGEENEEFPLLTELIGILRVLYTQMSSKMTNENRLATTIPELKVANERITLALGTVVSSFSLIRPLIEARGRFLQNQTVQDEWALETENQRKSRAYFERLRKEPPATIAYHDALQHRSLIVTASQSQQESAAKISQSLEKIAELEKQKQDLLLDHDLAQVSLAQSEKKIQGIQEELGKTKSSLDQTQLLIEKMHAKKRNVCDAATEPDPAIESLPSASPAPPPTLPPLLIPLTPETSLLDGEPREPADFVVDWSQANLFSTPEAPPPNPQTPAIPEEHPFPSAAASVLDPEPVAPRLVSPPPAEPPVAEGSTTFENQTPPRSRQNTEDFMERKGSSPVKAPEARRPFQSLRSESGSLKREDRGGADTAEGGANGRIRLTVTIEDQVFDAIPISSDQLARESLIKKHFESKVNTLTCQLQMVDSQAIKYLGDAKLLSEKLSELRDEKTQLEEERDLAKKAEKELLDRLNTTEKGYSTQLNVMTEHICTLNTKIAEQEGLIERYARARAQRAK